MSDIGEGGLDPLPVERRARRRERSRADTVVAAAERHDRRTAGREPSELQRRLDRVGARWAAELHPVGQIPRREDVADKGVEEVSLRRGEQVKAVREGAGVV